MNFIRQNLIIFFTKEMMERRECFTCLSQKVRRDKIVTPKAEVYRSKQQILLNSSNVMKGCKKKINQHIKTQLLKGAHTTKNHSSRNKSAKLLSLSAYQTVDNTPRQYQLQQTYYKDQNQFQIQDILQYRKVQIQNDQTQKLKIFNEILKSKFKKIIMSRKKDKIRPQSKLNSEIPQIYFKQTLFSIQLKRSGKETSHTSKNSSSPLSRSPGGKMLTQSLNINSINTQNYKSYSINQDDMTKVVYESINLNPRLNQYMNTIIKKTKKDELDLQKYMQKEEKVLFKQANQELSKYLVHDQLQNSFRNSKGIYIRNSKSKRLIRERNESKERETILEFKLNESRYRGKKIKEDVKEFVKSSNNKNVLAERLLNNKTFMH